MQGPASLTVLSHDLIVGAIHESLANRHNSS